MTSPHRTQAAHPRGRAALRWVRVFLAGSVIVICAALLLVGTVIPRLTGAMPYTVLTGSMEPSLPPGTLLIVRPVEQEQIQLGSVITYQLRSGQPGVVTHRVVGSSVSGNGERTFITQGDANSSPDAEPVRAAQVRGEVWYAVPYAGWIAQLVTGEQRLLLLKIVAAGLVLYALWMFASAVRDHRGHHTRAAPPHSSPSVPRSAGESSLDTPGSTP